MDGSKPVRRLLVVPELKEESADESSGSEVNEQGIKRTNSEVSQKQSSQDKEQTLRSYMYTKGQLIRVHDIDRMITREDFKLEESYTSRQNSAQIAQRLDSNRLLVQPTENPTVEPLVQPEQVKEELKLPPINQNRP